jgi:hypothetical protein
VGGRSEEWGYFASRLSWYVGPQFNCTLLHTYTPWPRYLSANGYLNWQNFKRRLVSLLCNWIECNWVHILTVQHAEPTPMPNIFWVRLSFASLRVRRSRAFFVTLQVLGHLPSGSQVPNLSRAWIRHTLFYHILFYSLSSCISVRGFVIWDGP